MCRSLINSDRCGFADVTLLTLGAHAQRGVVRVYTCLSGINEHPPGVAQRFPLDDTDEEYANPAEVTWSQLTHQCNN